MTSRSEPLNPVLDERLNALTRLGQVLDEQLRSWVDAHDGQEDDHLNGLLTDARRLIEQTVDMALASGQGDHPRLQSMRGEWQSRFGRLEQLIAQREARLTDEARRHIHQNQAVQSYVKTGQL